jgi:hypothetical protein
MAWPSTDHLCRDVLTLTLVMLFPDSELGCLLGALCLSELLPWPGQARTRTY